MYLWRKDFYQLSFLSTRILQIFVGALPGYLTNGHTGHIKTKYKHFTKKQKQINTRWLQYKMWMETNITRWMWSTSGAGKILLQ